VLAVTDPVTIGALCHGVLLVVRANVTSTRAIKRGQTLLEMAQVPIVGIVLNGFKITRGYSSNHYTDFSYYREAKKKPAGKLQTDRHSIKNGHSA
jgi:Mrp family chromosome partitioning ATPase